jgi:uncharacterized protein (TIGR03435 family)
VTNRKQLLFIAAAFMVAPNLGWPQDGSPQDGSPQDGSPQDRATPLPAFEVASVRLTRNGRNADGWSHSSVSSPSPGNFSATNASYAECIRWAWQVKDYQVLGPDWLNSDEASYDIVAKALPDTPLAQIRLMVQRLLAERLKLALHRETRTLPIYELGVARNGPKLPKPSADGRQSTHSQGGHVKATHVSMAELAYQISRWTGRPVFDKTGIEGAFDFTLDYAPDDRDTSGGLPSLFTAVQQQLGLKLEAARGPVEVLLIDHAERIPTEN